MRPTHVKETRQEFLRRIVEENNNPTECWLWPFSTDGSGYGQLAYAPDPSQPSLRRNEKAHRLAYFYRYGTWPVPLGRHMCLGGGTTLCFNPSHILPGTDADNVADRHAAGHTMGHVGSANGSAKLNEDIILQIRIESAQFGQQELANRYGVYRSTIRKILSGEAWPHVAFPEGMKRRYGTGVGCGHYRAKSSEYEIRAMREAFTAGLKSRKELAAEYNLEYSTVCYIVSGKHHASVK